jgi:hypothetical protein
MATAAVTARSSILRNAPSEAAVKSDVVTSSLLLIKIRSYTRADSSLTIPLSLVFAREEEMRQAATLFDIPENRWNGSMLYRRCVLEQQSHIVLDPERTCALQNYSSHLTWDPWLTSMLDTFYQTGQLRVPGVSQGFDLLLALEFFGILYSPDQLVFDTYQSYARVKTWSDYFTQRAHIADWVANRVIETSRVLHHHFGTVTHDRETAKLGNEVLISLQGVLARKGQSSATAVYGFFNSVKDDALAETMRQDFGVYLQNILTNVQVSFPVKAVTVIGPNGGGRQETRAVLMVDIVEPPSSTTKARTYFRSKSDLSYPVDEFVQDDMEANKLEEVVQSYKYRTGTSESPRQVTDNLYESRSSTDQIYDNLLDECTHRYALEPERPTNAMPKSSTGLSSVHGDGVVPLGTIDVVRIGNSDTRSITSALTGPFFRDGNGQLRDVHGDEDDAQAQALRQEWIQGSILNRDISTRVRELLEVSSVASDDEILDNRRRNPGTSSARCSSSYDDWDWLTGLCQMTFDAVKAPTIFKESHSAGTACTAPSSGAIESSRAGKRAHPVGRPQAPLVAKDALYRPCREAAETKSRVVKGTLVQEALYSRSIQRSMPAEQNRVSIGEHSAILPEPKDNGVTNRTALYQRALVQRKSVSEKTTHERERNDTEEGFEARPSLQSTLGGHPEQKAGTRLTASSGRAGTKQKPDPDIGRSRPATQSNPGANDVLKFKNDEVTRRNQVKTVQLPSKKARWTKTSSVPTKSKKSSHSESIPPQIAAEKGTGGIRGWFRRKNHAAYSWW